MDTLNKLFLLTLAIILSSQTGTASTSLSLPQDVRIDGDGFIVDSSLADSIDEEIRSRGEMQQEADAKRANQKTRDLFDNACPQGFFTCRNGECLSPKWRCDGHFDCDDQSDEHNCPNSHEDPPIVIKPTADPTELKFNSSIEPLMLFSTGSSIRGYWMRSRIYFDIESNRWSDVRQSTSITRALAIFFDEKSDLPAKPESTIVGVDMDPYDREVYWVELGKDAGVFSTRLDDETQKRNTIVESGLLSPEDIALDMVSRNIYITDAGLQAIVVCSIRASQCKILAEGNIHKPRAILADPATGWLTYTDWGDHPGIFLVSMDGRRRETLVDTDIVWPNGIAVDSSTNQLYFADARLSRIERIDLTTRKRREVIREAAANPFSLSLFEDRVYWSDWSGSDIRTCDKTTGNGTKVIMKADNVYGIHIYHPSTKSADQTNPCWSKRCSHLCLLGPAAPAFADRRPGSVTATCACPEGMTLRSGKRGTCFEVDLSFVLVNANEYVAQVFPERIGVGAVEKILHSKEHTIRDVAPDWQNYRLFMFDSAKRHIYLARLAGKKAEVEPFFTPTQGSVRGLLYDAWSDNLYWLDPESGTMFMYSMQDRLETVLRKDLEHPVSLALDFKNRVFYIAMLGKVPSILRMDFSGNKQNDLHITTDVSVPVALHLDEQRQRLYWADASLETIESLDLDVASASGIKRGSHIYHRKRLTGVTAFTVYRDDFLWTTKDSDYLHKARIDGSHQATFKLPPGSSSSDYRRIIMVDPLYKPTTVEPLYKPTIVQPASAPVTAAPIATVAALHEQLPSEGNRMVWLIVLLLLLSITGLVTLIALLILHRQGRLPRQVSKLSVSFTAHRNEKDGDMLLLNNDSS